MFNIRSVSFAYGKSPVLEDISFDVADGEMLGLIGPNGSGKTTLLRQLHGSLKPNSGQVLLDGHDIQHQSPKEIARQVAVVVQESPGDLSHTVVDTVLMGRIPHLKALQRHSRADEDLVTHALERVGALHLSSRGIDELSGGERQRVLMARALVQEAGCLLLDEPTNHLDIGFQHQLLSLVRSLSLTTVTVLHDLNLAARYCDTIVLLDHGQIQAIGPPEEVLNPSVITKIYAVGAEPMTSHDGTPQLLFHRESNNL